MGLFIVRKFDIDSLSSELCSKQVDQFAGKLIVIISIDSSFVLLRHFDLNINLLWLCMHPIELQKLQNVGVVNPLRQILQINVNLDFIWLHDFQQVVLVQKLLLGPNVRNILVHFNVVFCQWVLYFFVFVILFLLVHCELRINIYWWSREIKFHLLWRHWKTRKHKWNYMKV